MKTNRCQYLHFITNMLKCKYFYSKAKVLILLLWYKADILKSFYNYQVLSKPSSFIKLVFGRSQTLSTKKNTGLSRLFVVSERDLLVSSLRCDFLTIIKPVIGQCLSHQKSRFRHLLGSQINNSCTVDGQINLAAFVFYYSLIYSLTHNLSGQLLKLKNRCTVYRLHCHWYFKNYFILAKPCF